MSYELIPPETQAKDQLRWQGPPESKRPPGSSQGMSMLGPVPSIPAQVNPEAAAHLMAHYAESVQPAPEKDAHKAKEAPPHKGPGAHPEAKAKEPGPEIVHTGLGAKIDETAAKSSTLEHNLETLQKHGWVIKYGHKGAGTFADRNAKTITVDPQEKGQT